MREGDESSFCNWVGEKPAPSSLVKSQVLGLGFPELSLLQLGQVETEPSSPCRGRWLKSLGGSHSEDSKGETFLPPGPYGACFKAIQGSGAR